MSSQAKNVGAPTPTRDKTTKPQSVDADWTFTPQQSGVKIETESTTEGSSANSAHKAETQSSPTRIDAPPQNSEGDPPPTSHTTRSSGADVLQSIVDKNNAEVNRPMSGKEKKLRDTYVNILTTASTNLIIANTALAAIRNGKLWRETHPTFEAFCRDVAGISEARASQLIAAATQHASLKDKVEPELLPSTESAYRALQRVDEDRKPEVLQLAAKMSNISRPTAASIEEAWRTLRGESETEQNAQLKSAKPAQAIKSTKSALDQLQKVNRDNFTLSEIAEMKATVEQLHEAAQKIIEG